MFRLYAPLVFAMYKETADALFDSDKSLLRNFAKCVWTAATFNFGPRTVTFPHIDALNLAWGWCAIIALGLFNADLGGHLVLWDLKLIICFPAGSTILIPSALLRHSNLPIQDHESRYSFTQFAAAGLFRWVYNGFKSDKTFNATASKVTKAARREENAKRRMEGFKLFSTWKELSSM
jgi:hypothetical protein